MLGQGLPSWCLETLDAEHWYLVILQRFHSNLSLIFDGHSMRLQNIQNIATALSIVQYYCSETQFFSADRRSRQPSRTAQTGAIISYTLRRQNKEHEKIKWVGRILTRLTNPARKAKCPSYTAVLTTRENCNFGSAPFPPQESCIFCAIFW